VVAFVVSALLFIAFVVLALSSFRGLLGSFEVSNQTCSRHSLSIQKHRHFDDFVTFKPTVVAFVVSAVFTCALVVSALLVSSTLVGSLRAAN
jgi:hypothetical protein